MKKENIKKVVLAYSGHFRQVISPGIPGSSPCGASYSRPGRRERISGSPSVMRIVFS